MFTTDMFENEEAYVSRLIRKKARQLARRPGFTASDIPDLEQELWLEVFAKRMTFDRDRARESTFLSRIVRNKAISIIRTRSAEKRHFRRNGASLSEPVSDGDDRTVERGQTIDSESAKRHTGQCPRSDHDAAQLRRDIAGVLQTLPEDLRELAAALMQQSEYSLAKLPGKSRRQVAKDVARLMAIFEDAGLRDYL